MNNTPPRYADWKAPDEDAEHLLWPKAPEILRQTEENHRRLSNSNILIHNLPLAELRRRQRHAIGHTKDDQPLIASGHQTELYHPGVWVKDVLANAIAQKMSGQAWHLAVDTDAPKHLSLRWPGASMPITQDPKLLTAPWSGLLAAPSPAHVDGVAAALHSAEQGWNFSPLVELFLSSLRSQAEQNPSLATGLTSAIQHLDQTLNIHHQSHLMSEVWASDPYLIVAHHLLANASRFAHIYNSALGDYRREQHITSPGRPMPDLEIAPDEIETPFWLDNLQNQSRQRLLLHRKNNQWVLNLLAAPLAEHIVPRSTETTFPFNPQLPGEQAAKSLAEFLKHHQLRIAPRALPLTLFLRLFLADQFIHGIGGGRYDQVTDRIIHQFFNIEPPRFAVTTATLYFPAAQNQTRLSLRPLLREGRQIRHNSLSSEKRELAQRIATLPRRSRQRRDLFYEMHAKLSQQIAKDKLSDWSQRLEQATQEQTRQKSLFDREFFFALQSEQRLRDMISRYDADL
jgi:hypothetical protein